MADDIPDENLKKENTKKNSSLEENKTEDNSIKKPRDLKPSSKKKPNIPLYFLLGSVFLFLLMEVIFNKSSTKEMMYSDFLQYLNSGAVSFVKIVDQSYIEAIVNLGNSETKEYKVLIPYTDNDLIQLIKKKKIPFKGVKKSLFLPMLITNLPFIVFIIFIVFMFKQIRGGSGGIGGMKSKAKKYFEGPQSIKFDEVAGQDEAKYELEEVVEFLKNPKKYEKLGAKVPKGILLSGRPGTGKTLLARAVAGEAKVNFLHISGSDFIELFVGVGARRVRELFAEARKNAPSIIFIDELDAIGRVRSSGHSGSHEKKEQTLNQILVEMDGFEIYENIIIIGATNRIDVLDPALMRPGRFDRQININLPDVLEREKILQIHVKKIPLKDVSLKSIAEMTLGFSGADLKNLANESALIASRYKKDKVDFNDFNEAFDKILMGVSRKSNLLTMSYEEKLKTAYHESGHALIYYLIEDHASKINKVTILPRGRALGFAMHVPKKESSAYAIDSENILNTVCSMYGGYVAEKIIYNKTTSGVSQDLKVAREEVRKYVCEYGMSDLGAVYLNDDPSNEFSDSFKQKYSSKTLEKIDNEIAKILKTCLDRTISILEDNIEKLHILAKELVKKETLLDFEIRELLGFEKN